jgi:hypothetical protein
MALPVSKLLAVLTIAFKHGITLHTSIILTTNSDNTAVIRVMIPNQIIALQNPRTVSS